MQIIILIILGIIYFLPSWELQVPLVLGLSFFWIIVIFLTFIFIYKKRAKEYPPKFKEERLTEPPTKRTPEQLGYLFKRRLNINHLISNFMELIRKEAVIVDKNKETFIFYFSKEFKEELTKSEQYLINWFFNRMGNGESFSLNSFKKRAFTDSGFFMRCYYEWQEIVMFEGLKCFFFESKRDILERSLGYLFLSFLLIFLNIVVITNRYLILIMFLILILFTSYLGRFIRRTKEANEEYYKWRAFKRFLEDKEKIDLKKIEKWSIYAQVFRVLPQFKSKIPKNLEKINSPLLDCIKDGTIEKIEQVFKKSLFIAKIKGGIFSFNRGNNPGY
ncbi:MAG: DUF2207 family protein [Bacilli bacterium]